MKSDFFTLRLPPDLRAAVIATAEKERRKLSDMARILIEEALDNRAEKARAK
jgi:hypothetical protein